jgi:hypothetical protein
MPHRSTLRRRREAELDLARRRRRSCPQVPFARGLNPRATEVPRSGTFAPHRRIGCRQRRGAEMQAADPSRRAEAAMDRAARARAHARRADPARLPRSERGGAGARAGADQRGLRCGAGVCELHADLHADGGWGHRPLLPAIASVGDLRAAHGWLEPSRTESSTGSARRGATTSPGVNLRVVPRGDGACRPAGSAKVRPGHRADPPWTSPSSPR